MSQPKIKKSVLFLGYDNKQTILIDELIKKDCNVFCFKNKVENFENYDLVISFGYRHIIKKEIIEKTKIPIINLHISYLPWNRGSHPNFWSFFDETPSGVSIHLVDSGIDTGPIIAQKVVILESLKMNFRESYAILIDEIEKLFLKNIDQIINKSFTLKYPEEKGSYHSKSDLPKSFGGWDTNIKKEIFRLRKLSEKGYL